MSYDEFDLDSILADFSEGQAPQAPAERPEEGAQLPPQGPGYDGQSDTQEYVPAYEQAPAEEGYEEAPADGEAYADAPAEAEAYTEEPYEEEPEDEPARFSLFKRKKRPVNSPLRKRPKRRPLRRRSRRRK